MTASLRGELRSRERRFGDARVIANGLTVGQLYALGELEFASVHPGLRSSTAFGAATEATTRQERGFADLFKAALDVIPSTSAWADFASESGRTVVASPLDFFAATATGVRDYIEEELKGYADMATGVGSWLADAGACFLQQIPLFGPDSIGGSESCDGLKKVAESIETVARAIEKVRQLGFARLIEIGGQVLDVIGSMLNELLHSGMELLGEWKTDVEEWLRRIARSATELGKFLGTLLGSVLLEWLTAGVGRALKSARLARNLPARVPLPDVDSIRVAAETQLVLLRELGGRAAVSTQALIDRVTIIFQRILAKHGEELNSLFTLTKDRILIVNSPVRRDSPAYKLKRKHARDVREFNRRMPQVHALLRRQIRTASGRIGPHGPGVRKLKGSNTKFAHDLNNNAVTIHQADALSARLPEDNDVLHLEGRKNALVENFFESNHIVEQRLIKNRRLFAAYGKIWKKLEWTKIDEVTGELVPDVEAMTSILMPTAQHRSSLKRMLRRFGFAGPEADDIAQAFPESITTTLQRYLKIDGQGFPTPDPPRWPVLEIDSNNPPPFRTILDQLERIYRDQTPSMWQNPAAPNDLARQFAAWRSTLGPLLD